MKPTHHAPVALPDACERVARAAVDEAGALLRARWRTAKRIRYKSVIDLVTDTDRDAEALVLKRLQRTFPGHLVVGEEASTGITLRRPPADRYVWYLDPLDGTTNFAHAHPHFAVSLALAHGADVLLGIVHDPLRGETFVATRGGGATLNGQPIRVSTVRSLNRALLGTGFPYDRQRRAAFYLRFLAAFMTRTQGIRRAGSAALDLSYVACGRLDGFWEWKLRPWDIAAGALLVVEAGGRTSNFLGGPLDLYGPQTLASNSRVHRAMITVIGSRQ